MKTTTFTKKIVLGLTAAVSVVALVLFAFTPASTQAAALLVNEKAKIDLTGDLPGAKGQVELQLRIDVEGHSKFLAKATASGLAAGTYSLCAGGVFVDSAVAKDGKVTLEEDPSVPFTTIHGLVVTIQQGASCGGGVILEGAVP